MNLSRIFKEGLQMKNKKESGSIMLEVVAVLALMGVMGSMLFRQIYQRNQELHNIQMASEIRTVKEAFSAYIQANQALLLKKCADVIDPNNRQLVYPCDVSENLADEVKEYLPDGWFPEGDLVNAYTFTLWTYEQQDATQRQMFYGVVVPTKSTLPSSGWNFKRAARVALLIGADGGVYGKGITDCENNEGCISGTLGAWELLAEGIVYKKNDKNFTLSEDDDTYVAMTGLDIFAPEYLPPDGKVNLPKDWKLALQELHAYNYFSVGGGKDSGCYGIQHDASDPLDNQIKNDTVNARGDTCKPLFWVGNQGNGQGNVYVSTDLHLMTNNNNSSDPNLIVTGEGVIKQREGLTIDRDGRIIAKETVYRDLGDLKQGEHYILDPGHTSTMMDIRLASRGGVRLSDILPNYILKDTYTGSCWVQINDDGVFSNSDTYLIPNDGAKGVASWCDLKWGKNNTMGNKPETDFSGCPEGYNYAVVVTPIKFGSLLSLEQKKGHTHEITGSASSGAKYPTTPTTDTGDKFVSETVSCQFFAAMKQYARGNRKTADTDTDAQIHTGKYEYDGTGEGLHITMGYRAKDSTDATYNKCKLEGYKGEHKETLKAIIQTYCVWMPAFLKTQEDCEAAGYEWKNMKCETTAHGEEKISDGVTGAELGEMRCKASGFTWDSTAKRCTYIYMSASDINSITAPTGSGSRNTSDNVLPDSETMLRANACKAAGYTWNGSSCH